MACAPPPYAESATRVPDHALVTPNIASTPVMDATSATAPAVPPPSTVPAPTDPHSDDSYCALCRRCQMRKKLERRLAQKKGNGDMDDPLAHDDNLDHSGPNSLGPSSANRVPAQDSRSIDELLLFIGESSKQQKVRPRKKRVQRSRKLVAQSQDDPRSCRGSHFDGTVVISATNASDPSSYEGTDDGDSEVPGTGHQCSGIQNGNHPTSALSSPTCHPSSPGHEEHHSRLHEPGCDSPVSDDAHHVERFDERLLSSVGTHGATPGSHNVDAHMSHGPRQLLDVEAALCDIEGDEMTREEQEAIDQEVEEFRLCLESVCPAPPVLRTPVSF